MTRSRFVGAGTPVSSLSLFDMPGRRNNRVLSWGGVWDDAKSSVPAGYSHPNAILLAFSPGGMSSFGRITASASLTTTGALIVSGACAITASATVAGTLVGAASGEVAITASASVSAAIGALAGAVCTITASASTTGTLTGIGHMEAEILPYTELSPQALASAVWSATAALYDTPGTMGAKVNAAGGAADPWDDERALTVPKFIALK